MLFFSEGASGTRPGLCPTCGAVRSNGFSFRVQYRHFLEPILINNIIYSFQFAEIHHAFIATLLQILFERKRRGRVCHSLPRPDSSSHQHTKNSQLFFDLLLVWQQLSSRFSKKGAESHEAHLLLAALKLAIAAQSQQRHGLDDRCDTARE